MDLEGYSGNTVWDLDSTMVERYSSAILKYTLTIFGRNCDLRMVIVMNQMPTQYTTSLCSCSRHETYYECCPEPFVDITYTIKMVNKNEWIIG